MKKKPTTKNPSLPSGVERYTVGKAFTEKQRYRLHITAMPPSPEARAMIGPPPRPGSISDGEMIYGL